MNTPPATPPAPVLTATPEDDDLYDAMEAILADMRTRYDETPQWEFCDGFMAALVCCRRAIPQAEYLDVLLGIGNDPDAPVDDAGAAPDAESSFADAAQRDRFLQLWHARWAQVQTALDTAIESLDDEAAYYPDVMDMRGAIAALPEAERPDVAHEAIPALGQVGALGFMFAVEAWPEEWAPPSDKKDAKWHDLALQSIVALTEDDAGAPEYSAISDDAPPTLSNQRMEAFVAALWAVYDLREIWRNIGPRVETLRRADVPGRNDPCHCGSGKKYKKCHGSA